MQKAWTDDGWEDYLYWQSQDRKTLKRINKIIEDIERTGSKGIGKAEILKNGKGYSRRIDDTNRLVYTFRDNELIIISCRGHYKD